MFICISYQYASKQDGPAPSWDYSNLPGGWKWYAGKYSPSGDMNFEWFSGPGQSHGSAAEYLRGCFSNIINDGIIEKFEIVDMRPPMG